MKKLLNLIKNEISLILTLILLVSIGLIFWFSSSKTEDFGLNFFTEMLGVVVTVLIIDRLIRKREESKNIPQKLAVYEDVRLYTSRYISFWTTTFRETVPEPDPTSIKDFFSDNGMTKILSNLHMDAEPNVFPARKWWDWIIQNAKEFKDRGDKILDRHSNNLEPIVFGHIHQLTESTFNNFLLNINAIRQSDQATNFPRVKVLASYSMKPPQEDFDAILGLIDWCEKSYTILKKYNKSILKVSEYNPIKDKKMPPKSMIPELVLNQQIEAQEQHRQKK